MKIGTLSWWSPPQPPAGSKVPRPATTAPVDMSSAKTRPLTPVRTTSISSESARVNAQSCRRCPPSPSPLPGPALGPAMNPSRDMDISRTVADMGGSFWLLSTRPCGAAKLIPSARCEVVEPPADHRLAGIAWFVWIHWGRAKRSSARQTARRGGALLAPGAVLTACGCGQACDPHRPASTGGAVLVKHSYSVEEDLA